MTVLRSIMGEAHLQFETIRPFKHMDRVEEVWMEMLVSCQHSYFTSWGWISTWLASLPREYDIQLILGHSGDKPVVAYFVGQKKGAHHGFWPARVYSLNSTGNLHFDQLFIEYNSILTMPNISTDIIHLLSPLAPWDEILLPGVSHNFVTSMKLLERGGKNFFSLVDMYENSYYVDLQKVRDVGMNFLGLLSPNRRRQIRRSIKQYELDGKIHVCEAENYDEALTMFDDLVILHQRNWKKRGRPGVFANSHFYEFHKDLITNRFGAGEIQILKIFNDKITIGYLYNFVYQQNILFYQSGFTYTEGNVYRPGFVSHYLGILHNAANGFAIYDFLAGESQYKVSLATNSTPMYWMRLFNKSSRFYFEKWLLGLKQKRRQLSKSEVLKQLKTPLKKRLDKESPKRPSSKEGKFNIIRPTE